MRIFKMELWLARPRDEVFQFFSDAQNLETLTPPWLNFHVLTPAPIAMQAGALIDYRLRVHGIPLRWQSEISVWEPPVCFVDAQRRGPYTAWVHAHLFEEKDGGTLVKDCVHYSVFGGALIDRLFVQRDVREIFEFRRQKLLKLFPNPS
jgi:ligand-binding SRPBCC domain-containing protein